MSMRLRERDVQKILDRNIEIKPKARILSRRTPAEGNVGVERICNRIWWFISGVVCVGRRGARGGGGGGLGTCGLLVGLSWGFWAHRF